MSRRLAAVLTFRWEGFMEATLCTDQEAAGICLMMELSDRRRMKISPPQEETSETPFKRVQNGFYCFE